MNENQKKHLDHLFYKEVNAYREEIRIGQILKGAEKYPEPFTTASWSNGEIVEHAMQENVDQAHYIYAAKERMDILQSRIDRAINILVGCKKFELPTGAFEAVDILKGNRDDEPNG